MKIGILSMQKVPNYGSFLQAFSLKLQFERRGHTVEFMDIIPGRQIHSAELIRKNILKKFDRYVFKRIAHLVFAKKMLAVHKGDYDKYLKCSIQDDSSVYDLAVIGSDEVFNGTVRSSWGFSTQLFGNVNNANRVVSYAASCGSTRYEDAEKFGLVDDIADAMSHLEYISVRDENTRSFVKKITDRTPMLHVDPVFISDFTPYIPRVKARKPYLLVYAYGNRISDPSEIKAIKEYAKKNHLDILSVGMQQRWCKHNIVANAFELLAYVKNASCIVTDTFHGTVFSIKYNKRFATLIRDSNRNKLADLLSHFSLESRSVNAVEGLEIVLDTEIDYKIINSMIKYECDKSYKYIDLVTGVLK